MDSNKYRRGKGTKYKNSSLTVAESIEFLARINKRSERSCLICGKRFTSHGAHNRRCPKCTIKFEYAERMSKTREPLVYRTHASGVRSTAFHAEIGE